jgi:hypothetical protein
MVSVDAVVDVASRPWYQVIGFLVCGAGGVGVYRGFKRRWCDAHTSRPLEFSVAAHDQDRAERAQHGQGVQGVADVQQKAHDVPMSK